MPFAVFRRHQRKLLAVFAILAMFGFVVADSLPRLLSGGYAGGANPEVTKLYGKSIHRSDIALMQQQRLNANSFMAELLGRMLGRPSPQFFGELNTRALVDALILEHEADRLGMPTGPDVGREWLKQQFGTVMTRELFELILSQFNNRVSGEQLLADIGNQVRIGNVRMMLGTPVVTPLDVYSIYRDQNERVSAKAVGFRVEDYLSKVGEPSGAEVTAYFEKYKDVLPDPNRPTPGFKVPRQVKVEILSIDGEALARSIRDKLTDAELQAYYENRKTEFKIPSEFPDQLFAGDDENKLTPPQVQPFVEVRPYLATSLAEERAQAEIVAKFTRVKEEHMIPFADTYLDVADAIEEAKKAGEPDPKDKLPKPESLESVAKKEGLQYDGSNRLLSREDAEHYGLISSAEVGLTRMSGGRKFADELFDTKSVLFEPIELTDFTGHRFLVRKLEDNPPRVPALDQIRPDVVLAWKTEKARPLAEKAARDYAEKLRKEGGKINGDVVDGHPVITTDPITRMQPGLMLPGRFLENGPATPSEISQLPQAGPALRDAYFDLTEGSVAVAPNQPQTIYYTLTLNRRIPATFATLYAPNGDFVRYRNEALMEARKSFEENMMAELRTKAGLAPDWEPADERTKTKGESDSAAG
ncbi:MAG: hypothetical protein U0794_06085 [Isosphaeraceae bacterium]